MGTINSKTINAHHNLNIKECEHMSLELDIDEAIKNKNREHLDRIKNELISLINSLQILKIERKWDRSIYERIKRLLYNYELTLDKVNSIINTLTKRSAKRNCNGLVIRHKRLLPQYETHDSSYSVASVEDSKKDNSSSSVPTTTEYINNNKSNGFASSSALTSTGDTNNDQSADESVFANTDDVQSEDSHIEKKTFEVMEKTPVPVPRTEQDLIMEEIPMYFARLNSILLQFSIRKDDVDEVYVIRNKCNEVRNMFADKIEKIFNRYEESLTKDEKTVENTVF